jgi:hypothetical protein
MVEFSRIWSTTPARPRRIDEKAQSRRTVPDDAWQILAVFAVLQQIISQRDLDSRRNPGRPAGRRTKEQPKLAVLSLFP